MKCKHIYVHLRNVSETIKPVREIYCNQYQASIISPKTGFHRHPPGPIINSSLSSPLSFLLSPHLSSLALARHLPLIPSHSH